MIYLTKRWNALAARGAQRDVRRQITIHIRSHMRVRITILAAALTAPAIAYAQTHESAFGPNFPPWRQCLLGHVLERDADDPRSHETVIDQAFADCEDLEEVFLADVPAEHHETLKANIKTVLRSMVEIGLKAP